LSNPGKPTDAVDGTPAPLPRNTRPGARRPDPAPAERVAACFGSIVEGVTAGWDDPADGCALTTRCIGLAGRRRCTDRVVARIAEGRSTDDAGNLITARFIAWSCLTCGEYGEIHHWQDTPRNLTGSGNAQFPTMDVVADLEMTLAEYEAVAAMGHAALRGSATTRCPTPRTCTRTTTGSCRPVAAGSGPRDGVGRPGRRSARIAKATAPATSRLDPSRVGPYPDGDPQI
jgi:hypothetical protein